MGFLFDLDLLDKFADVSVSASEFWFTFNCFQSYENLFLSRYSWCSEAVIKDKFRWSRNPQLCDLIPLESSPEEHGSNLKSNQKKVIIGHNVGFDRSFVKEQYYIEVNSGENTNLQWIIIISLIDYKCKCYGVFMIQTLLTIS